jgi:hypothetical protein
MPLTRALSLPHAQRAHPMDYIGMAPRQPGEKCPGPGSTPFGRMHRTPRLQPVVDAKHPIYSIRSNLNVTGRNPSVQQEIIGTACPEWRLWSMGLKSLHAQWQKPSGGSHLLSVTNTCPSSNLPHALAAPYGYNLYNSSLNDFFNTVILHLYFSSMFDSPWFSISFSIFSSPTICL